LIRLIKLMAVAMRGAGGREQIAKHGGNDPR